MFSDINGLNQFFNTQKNKRSIPCKESALPGRAEKMIVSGVHTVLGTSMLLTQTIKDDPDMSFIILGMGCFWGVERVFWSLEGVYSTAVGYCAGHTPNPTYDEVCSGMTGHNEVVLVIYRRSKITLEKLLHIFWESHDPTQGMRQGNDNGTQYRSGIYCALPEEIDIAQASKKHYAQKLSGMNKEISTQILIVDDFYYAEEYHQQYLYKNPKGYCNLLTVDKTGHPKFLAKLV